MDMGWLRLVGSIKLQVSFAKEPYKRDDILPKRPTILVNTYMSMLTHDRYMSLPSMYLLTHVPIDR